MTTSSDRLRKLNDELLITGQDYSDVLLDAAKESEHMSIAAVAFAEAFAKAMAEKNAEIADMQTEDNSELERALLAIEELRQLIRERDNAFNFEIERLRSEVEERNAQINRLVWELGFWKDSKLKVAMATLDKEADKREHDGVPK